MSKKCSAMRGDGTPCGTFSIVGSDPPKCIFHTPMAELKFRVYTPQWEMKKRIRILNRRLNALNKITNEAVRSKLTLDIITMIGALEAQLKAMDTEAAPPAAGTTAEKLASWEKSLT